MFLILKVVVRFVEMVEFMYFGMVNGLMCFVVLVFVIVWCVVSMVDVDGLLELVISLVCLLIIWFLFSFVFVMVWFIVIWV